MQATVQSGSTSYSYQLGTGYAASWPGSNNGWFTFTGLIDEPTVYAQALTADQVVQIVAASTNGKCLPARAAVKISTNPAGQALVIDNQTFTSAVSATWIVGSTHTLYATPPTGQALTGWGDGTSGNPYTFTVPAGGANLVASFGKLKSQLITFGKIATQTAGGSLTLTATASSGLAVSFSSLTTSVCAVSGNTASLIAIGQCSIQANQSGNSVYQAANPVTQSFTIKGQAQTITFGAMGAQLIGTTLTLTATSSSGLPVSFSSSTPTICTVSGPTASFLAAGTCTIIAAQPGNTLYAAAPNVSRSAVVKTQSQTVTFGPIPSQVIGTPLALVATASSGLPVTFSTTTTMVCSTSGTTANFVATGTCTIVASQQGNDTYAAASQSRSFTVNREPQIIAFPTVPPQLVGTTFTVAATATSGLPVTFTASTTAVCSVSGSTVTLVASGTCTIKAIQGGNATWAPAPTVQQSFSASGQPQTITFAPLSNQVVGSRTTLSASSSSGLTVSFASQTTSVCTVSGTTAKFIATGQCTIVASQSGNKVYAAATPISQTITVAAH
jgi:hypothetical protein